MLVSIPDETYRHNRPLAVLVVRERPAVIWGSFVFAAVVGAIFAWIYWGNVTAFEVTGFFMSAWALVLALAIYIAQSADPGVLARDLQASKLTLQSQMLGDGADGGTGTRQGGTSVGPGSAEQHSSTDEGGDAQAAHEDSGADEDLPARLEKYKDYVTHLLREYPKLPINDITYVGRAPGKARNPSVLVRTKRGHTYSVFHGGRHGGWYVTDLT